jgi:hypothetical protein
MKKFLCWGITLAVMLVAQGCGDDDSPDNPLTPGDPNDPAFEAFMEEFDEVDEITGDMVMMTFLVMDGIFTSQATGGGNLPEAAEFSLVYNTETEFWVAHIEDFDPEEGITFSVVDSVQLIQEGAPVQWPDPELLSQITSFKTLTITGEEFTAAGGHQNLVLTIDPPGSNMILINGSGRVEAAVEFQEEEPGGVTSCAIDVDMAYVATDILLELPGEGQEEPGCPVSGGISYTGAIGIECTGAREISLSGSWTVSQTFDSPNVTSVASNGNNVWTVTELCE